MQVSIIIINYNTFKLTCACIQSVIDKTAHIAYEIILVDNGSVECNPNLFKEKFPGIILVVSEKNSGFAAGNNLGLQVAKGEYVLLLNSDTILVENCILLSIEKIKTLKDIGFLGIKAVFPDGSVQDTCSRLPTVKNVLYDLFLLHHIFPGLKNYYTLSKNFSPDAVWGCYMLFKKELLTYFKDNKLDESFFMYREDLLWCWQARKLNYTNYYYADTKLIHINKGSQNGDVVKEKMNLLMIDNYEKLKIIINGKVGIHFYNLLKKMLFYRSYITKRISRNLFKSEQNFEAGKI